MGGTGGVGYPLGRTSGREEVSDKECFQFETYEHVLYDHPVDCCASAIDYIAGTLHDSQTSTFSLRKHFNFVKTLIWSEQDTRIPKRSLLTDGTLHGFHPLTFFYKSTSVCQEVDMRRRISYNRKAYYLLTVLFKTFHPSTFSIKHVHVLGTLTLT